MLGRALIAVIRFYQLAISPWTPGSCRFTPTCSAYAIEAVREHGTMRGLWMAARRVGRCHPWGGFGYDPVPPADRSSNVKLERRDLSDRPEVDAAPDRLIAG